MNPKGTMDSNFTITATGFPFPNASLSVTATEMTTSVTTSVTNESCLLGDSSLRLPLAVFYSLFFILGLAGNMLALWVFLFLQSKKKKNSIQVFLINVALADLLLVGCLPFRVLYHSRGDHWELGPVACKVVGNLFYMNMYISITLLGCISVDRYLKIRRGTGMHGRRQATKWTTVGCGAIWALALATALPMILISERNEEPNRCFQYKQRRYAKGKAIFNLLLVVMFWLVFFCLVVSYGKIALRLQRISRDKPDLPNAARYQRTARKSFFVLFLFTVCFVPYHLARVFYITSQITETSCSWKGVVHKVNEVALLFSAFNSCLDPVMYFLFSSSVRKETFRLVNNVFHLRVAGGSGSGSSGDFGRSSGEEPTSSQRVSFITKNKIVVNSSVREL